MGTYERRHLWPAIIKYQHHMCYCRRAVSVVQILISSVDIVVAAAWTVHFFLRGQADTIRSTHRLSHTHSIAQWSFLRVRSGRFLFVFQFTRQQIFANRLNPFWSAFRDIFLAAYMLVTRKLYTYASLNAPLTSSIGRKGITIKFSRQN